MAVVDAWQRRGVGRRLVRAPAEHAAGLGYEELHGDVLPESRAMLRLLADVFPGSSAVHGDGVVHVRCRLAATEPSHEDLVAAPPAPDRRRYPRALGCEVA